MNLDEAQKGELLGTIIDESERLNRFIANLLDMTKLESGAVTPNVSLHDLSEIVGSTLRRASRILAQHEVQVDLAADLPMLLLDAVLFEQVLFNLLDNAAKYAPGGTTIRIQSRRDRSLSGCRSWTKATAYPQLISSTSSTSSTGRRRATKCAREPASDLPFRAASSKPWARSITAANRSDRSGAVFTIRMPIPAERGQLDTAA